MQRLAALADVGRYGARLIDNDALKQSILRRWFRSGVARERTVAQAVHVPADNDGLSSLTRIDGALYLYENTALANIDGLSP